MGLVAQYARNLSKAQTPLNLISESLSSLKEFGLSSTVQIRLESEDIIHRSDNLQPTAIEIELLDLAKSSDRITHTGKKYIFSGKSCSFLIKNMPIDDQELTGRLRDHLAIMIETCDAYVELINYKQKSLKQNNQTALTANSQISKDFEKIINIFSKINNNSKNTFNGLIGNIEKSFIFLGLTEDQEHQISKYIDIAKDEIDQLLDESEDLYEIMQDSSNAVRLLSEIATNHE